MLQNHLEIGLSILRCTIAWTVLSDTHFAPLGLLIPILFDKFTLLAIGKVNLYQFYLISLH